MKLKSDVVITIEGLKAKYLEIQKAVIKLRFNVHD